LSFREGKNEEGKSKKAKGKRDKDERNSIIPSSKSEKMVSALLLPFYFYLSSAFFLLPGSPSRLSL